MNNKLAISTYILMALALFLILKMSFVLLLFVIILTYSALNSTNHFLMKILKINDKQKNAILGTFLLSSVFIGLISWLGFELVQNVTTNNLQLMFDKFLYLLETLRNNTNIPEVIKSNIPHGLIELKTQAMPLIKDYIGQIGLASKKGITSFVYIVLGFVIGIMLSFHTFNHNVENQPEFKAELLKRIINFKNSFDNVFLAQIKISFVNAILTAIYLLIILPLFGVKIPFAVAIIFITFFTGLIPVVGNLISNTIIVIFGLSISFSVAVASLIFLIVIHKLEYFLNAKIIGGQIDATAWELLIVMLVFEHIFGITGMIVAPIYYSYLKTELKQKNMI